MESSAPNMDGRSQIVDNIAENSIAVLVIIVMTAGLVSAQPPREEWSPLWDRCQSILKQQATGPCTDHQVTACEGKKDNDSISIRPGYYCNERTKVCPGLPQFLDVQVFHHEPFTTKSDSYIGLNVSWGVRQTGNESDFLTKQFELRAELSNGNFIAHVTVNFTADDFINGVATVYYDCIYPIVSDVNTLINVVLKTLPHARGHYLHMDVNTIPRVPNVDSTESNALTTSATAITTAISTSTTLDNFVYSTAPDKPPEDDSTVNDVTTGMSPVSIVMEPPFMQESSEPRELRYTNLVLPLGLLGGLASVGVLCLSVFLVYQRWKRNKKKGLQQPRTVTLTSYNNTSEGCHEKVLVVSQRDFNQEQSRLYTEMMVRLRETLGHVVDVLDLDADGDTRPYDVVYSELTAADRVIIVMSEELQQVLVRVQAKYEMDLIRGSLDLVYLALFMLKRDMTVSRLHEMKTLTLYAGDFTVDAHCADLSNWESLPLRGGIDKLISVLQGHSQLKPRRAPDSAGTRWGLTDELQLSSLSSDSGFYNNGTSPVASGPDLDELSTVPVRLPFQESLTPTIGQSYNNLPPEPGRFHRSKYSYRNHAHRPTLNSNAHSVYPNTTHGFYIQDNGPIRPQVFSRPDPMPTMDMDSVAIDDDVSDINKSFLN